MSCQLESKEEASTMYRVGAKAPAVLAHEPGPRSPPAAPRSHEPFPGLWAETKLTPASPSVITSVHGPLHVGDTVTSGDSQLAPAMPPLCLQDVTPSESSGSITPSASVYYILLCFPCSFAAA